MRQSTPYLNAALANYKRAIAGWSDATLDKAVAELDESLAALTVRNEDDAYLRDHVLDTRDILVAEIERRRAVARS